MAQNFSASSQASLLRRILHRVAFIFLLIFSFLLIFLGKPDNIIIQNTSEFLIQITGKTVTIVSKPFIYIRDSFETLKNLFGVENENRVLRHTIELLNSRVNELKNLESENQELKNSLRFVQFLKQDFISARIVVDNSSIFTHSFLIEAGSNQGIEKYQAVISKGNLIGRIISVTPQYSRVLLITDIDSHIPVILEKSRVRAFLSGNNDDYPKLTHIEQKGLVTEKEDVLTSGFDGILPYGIRIGFVAGEEEEAPFIQPYTNRNDIEIVNVLKNNPRFKDLALNPNPKSVRNNK
jgi:rod shape-determining protein MreC